MELLDPAEDRNSYLDYLAALEYCPAINKALMCLTVPLTLGPAVSSPFAGEAALILDHFVIFKNKNLLLQPFLYL